jgi:hypothetical protein
VTKKEYLALLRARPIPLRLGTRSPIMKQKRLPTKPCRLCKQPIDKPTNNQKVHACCRRAWKKLLHAEWWRTKGAAMQPTTRAERRARVYGKGGR